MNEIHCDIMSLDSSLSPGRVPSVLAVLYGTPKTYATSWKCGTPLSSVVFSAGWLNRYEKTGWPAAAYFSARRRLPAM